MKLITVAAVKNGDYVYVKDWSYSQGYFDVDTIKETLIVNRGTLN